MFRGRGGVLLFVVIIILILALFFFLRRDGGFGSLFGGRGERPVIPLDLQALVPPGWEVQAEPQLQCDFDDDGEREWMVVYRYNSTSLPQPLVDEDEFETYAPFGGVIYDTQPDTLQPQPDSPGPYRASNIVPYKLLPDYYQGKGQGYLGETGVDVRYAPGVTDDEECTTDEIIVYGFNGGALPTRLSVFRWAGSDLGYQVVHYAGDARVQSTVDGPGQIKSVTTYNRLLNHRSVLCEVEGQTRPNLDLLTFIPDAAVQTIDFCFGTPNDPVYPEGVVVAILRGAPSPSNTDSPRYILDDAQIPSELKFLTDPDRRPISIVSVGNPSSVDPVPVRGEPCTTDQIDTADKGALWCGRERVRIETRIMLEGVARDVVWILISVIPNRPNGDLYWRVQKVELP